MLFKSNFAFLISCAASIFLVHPLLAQSGFSDLPGLSRVPAVIDAGPRTWHFSIDYNNAGPDGAIVQRQRLTGDYTRGLPNHEVEWHNVTTATAQGASAPFSAPEKSAFMEGFRYANDPGATMGSDFFKSFPPNAFMERNLVWDTGMFETFGQAYLDKLHLNQPFHTLVDQDMKLPGVGTFQNRDVVLEWVGRSWRNGQDCALIQYQGFLNPVSIDAGGMTMKARSDYWGTIWVSLSTRQIEYATLNEEVTGEIALPGQSTPQPLNVLRVGTFEQSATH
jgi:hypothetical protein